MGILNNKPVFCKIDTEIRFASGSPHYKPKFVGVVD